ncbi:MAG: very short patch repair endonuclease [Chloroflexota bacterium]|nr:very short patch repair endonuclease [Chloroflexota bacterium]
MVEANLLPRGDSHLATRRDPFTQKQRSETMRRIRRKDTKPEIALRKELFRRGLRYRVDYARVPGRPDIAMVGRRLAIFVDGEFWHGKKHTAERYAEMTEYWRNKIARNMDRDRRVNGELRDLGWTVVRVTDRAVLSDVSAIADFVGDAADGRFQTYPPPGVEIMRSQP